MLKDCEDRPMDCGAAMCNTPQDCSSPMSNIPIGERIRDRARLLRDKAHSLEKLADRLDQVRFGDLESRSTLEQVLIDGLYKF
jgi:hypothetical protein